MAEYVIFYRGMRQIDDEAESRRLKQKFMDWLGALGNKVVSPGTPLGNNKRVSAAGEVSDDNSDTRMVGYTVVKADDMETALGYAKDCPHLLIGTIEVAEAYQMPMD